MAVSKLRLVYSLVLTTTLLIGSLVVFHQTNQFSSSRFEKSTLMWILEKLCPTLSIFCYISPAVSVVAMIRNSDDSEFPIAVLLAQAAQNVVCVSYGFLIDNDPFIISSAVGLSFQVIWMTAWYIVFRRRARERKIWRILYPPIWGLLLALSLMVLTYILTYVDKDIVGSLSVCLTLVLCISPLAKLGVVIRTRNSASIPIVMSLVMLAANISWAMYGMLIEDSYVFLPSLFGLVIAVFQLIVTAWCSDYLFYDLTFLQWLFTQQPAVAYHPVSPSKRQISSNSSIYTLEEQRIE